MVYEYNETENLHLTTKGWRVKLYRLNTDGSWDDCGTGRIAVFFKGGEQQDAGEVTSSSSSDNTLQGCSHSNQEEIVVRNRGEDADHNDENNVIREDSEDKQNGPESDAAHATDSIEKHILCMHAEQSTQPETASVNSVMNDNSNNSVPVTSVPTPRVLLRVPVLTKEAYQRQGDNIITWCEPNFHFMNRNMTNIPIHEVNGPTNEQDESSHNNRANSAVATDSGVDLALSFQDNAGCLDIWNQISEIQRLFHASNSNTDVGIEDIPHSTSSQSPALQQHDTQQQYVNGVVNENTSNTLSNSPVSIVADDDENAAANTGAEQNTSTTGYLDYTSSHTVSSAMHHGSSNLPSTLNFPQVSCANLEQVANLVLLPSNNHQFSQILLCNNHQYFFDLLEIFDELETACDYDNLANLAVIVKTVLLLNEPGIVELICENLDLPSHQYSLSNKDNSVSANEGTSSSCDNTDVFTRVCAILEYDPDLRVKANHRQHLSRVKFRTVLEIENETLLQAIFKSFRATYLRDTLLRPTMDDGSISTLSSYIYFTHADVIREVTAHSPDALEGVSKDGLLGEDCYLLRVLKCLAEDASYLASASPDELTELTENTIVHSGRVVGAGPFIQKVAPADKSYRSTIERRNVAIMFLRELFGIVRGSLQPSAREDFLDIFLQTPLSISMTGQADDEPPTVLSIFALLLDQLHGYHQELTSLLDILVGIFYHDTPLVRSYAIQHATVSGSLIYVLIKLLHTTTDTAIHTPLLEALRTLLDTSDDHVFIQCWYDHYFAHLVSLDHSTEGIVLGQVCDLLAFCVGTHSHACKFYLLQKDRSLVSGLVSRGLKQYLSRCVKLSALRLVRAIVATKDDFYFKHIIGTSIFKNVFDCFRANPVGDNLVSSAVVELCEFIRSETPSTLLLLDHIIKKHLSDDANLEQLAQQYVGTFTLMRKKYEEHQQVKADASASSTTSSVTTSSNKRSWTMSAKAIEENRKFRLAGEEESYFMDDDEDEESGTGLGALLQYGSDDEKASSESAEGEASDRTRKKQKFQSSKSHSI